MNVNLPYSQSQRQEDFSMELQNPAISQLQTSTPSDMQFDRIQTSDKECDVTHKIEFGQYVARAAIVDEEFWTAAWLRAESHWEDRPPERYMESYKRKYADQEFNALKRRCSVKHIQKCTCIVAKDLFYHLHKRVFIIQFLSNYQIKKEEKNVKRTVIKSIVGTLDLSIRNLLHGERFPGDNDKPPIFSSINRMSPHQYGYVANLCVSKFARRKGIASNMLSFAIESARLQGVGQVFVHVHRENTRAQQLYEKMGFQIVEMATSHLLQEENYLMSLKS
ncbi:hypothetical protein IFM89_019827 [Coptis chinensis]|uniref:N-acetyltransferase domain-containing protein n=1 Tax=Coptis chinensis TaxID=261450 RepID=A0A835ICM0_9MAGN|nr:hypothetical protein IFM89_019827 [Coptis chinensis]